MKFTALITEILMDSQLCGSTAPMPLDRRGHKILGRYIGSAEVILECVNTEEGPEYVSDYYLAYEIVSGEIVAVDGEPGKTPIRIRSLKSGHFILHKGVYPIGFPEEWRAAKPATPSNAKPIEVDELPF